MKIKKIFFCHGGIHGVFLYLGAIKELYKERKKLDLKRLRIYGSSSGASLGLICLMVLNDILEIDMLIGLIKDFFAKNPNMSLFQFTQLCVELLESLCLQIRDPERVLTLANKHLYIGVSQPTKFKFIKRFTSFQEMLHCLLLSANLVLLATYPAYYNDVVSIDGGFRMTPSDLPKRCMTIYNRRGTVLNMIGLPDQTAQTDLIREGRTFIKEKLHQTNVFYDCDEYWCFYENPEIFLQLAFFLQTYFAIKDESWKKRIDSIKFKL